MNSFWLGFEKQSGLVDRTIQTVGNIIGKSRVARSSAGEGVKKFTRGVQQKVQSATQAAQQATEKGQRIARSTELKAKLAPNTQQIRMDDPNRAQKIRERLQSNRARMRTGEIQRRQNILAARNPEAGMSRLEREQFRKMDPKDIYKAKRHEARLANREGREARNVGEVFTGRKAPVPHPNAPTRPVVSPSGNPNKKPAGMSLGTKALIGGAAIGIPASMAYTAGASSGMEQQQAPAYYQ